MRVPLRVISLLAVTLLFPSVVAAQYAPIDLGTLGGRNSSARDLNDHGQVVGYSDAADGTRQAFSWTATGGMVGLSLGGSEAYASSVNNDGLVVGWGRRTGGEARAFVWTADTGIVELGTLGGSWSQAIAINERGEVIGDSALPGDAESHAFLWTAAGGMVDLGIPGAWSSAAAISDEGHVVGRIDYTLGYSRAFLWTAADGLRDLGSLGGLRSEAFAVNAHGHVIGSSTIPGEVYIHAFSWTATEGMLDLAERNIRVAALNAHDQLVGLTPGPGGDGYYAASWTPAGGLVVFGGLSSVAQEVNDNGQVAGWYFDYVNGGSRAFLWTAAGGMVGLGTLPDGDSSEPAAINALGQVAGSSTAAPGEPGPRHATLWSSSPFSFDGFYGLRNPPALNEVVAGGVVSLAFRLGGNYGLEILETGYPLSHRIYCSESEVVGPIDPATGPALGHLLYKPETDRYTYAWKTDRNWAGTCRQLRMRLSDGTTHSAYFSFR